MPFVFKIRKELQASGMNVSSVAKWKIPSRQSDIVKNVEFVQQVPGIIDENPEKSMRTNADLLHVPESTIRYVVNENISNKSYVMMRRQFISSPKLLNKLKHPKKSNIFCFFFLDSKNFVQDQKVNIKNDSPTKIPKPIEISIVIHSNFLTSVMVMRFVINKGHVRSPQFLKQGCKDQCHSLHRHTGHCYQVCVGVCTCTGKTLLPLTQPARPRNGWPNIFSIIFGFSYLNSYKLLCLEHRWGVDQ